METVAAKTKINTHPEILQWSNQHGLRSVQVVVKFIPTFRVKMRPLDAELWHLNVVVEQDTVA